MFASSESSQLPTDQGHVVKLPDVRRIPSSTHALDQSDNFCLRHISDDLLLEDED